MNRPPRQDHRLTKVLDTLRTHGGPGRSPLYRWMRRHHDALAAAFAETVPAWDPLAARFASLGLTDANGKSPNATSARQTWYRVRRDVAEARARPAPSPPVLAPTEIAPGVHAVPPALPEQPPLAASPGPSGPLPRSLPMSQPVRTAMPEAPIAAARAAPATGEAAGTGVVTTHAAAPVTDTPAPESADQQLERLFGSMNAKKVPLPKIM